jgi:hypothetical protein
MDIAGARDRALLVVNQMKLAITKWPSDGERDYSDTLFLLAGFSWRRSQFEIWRFVYRRRHGKFHAEPVRGIRGLGEDRLIYFAGDRASQATSRLAHHLRQSGALIQGPIDMEPLRALMDLCLDETPATHTIGGAPHVSKVFRHQNATHFAVKWPPNSDSAYFWGRRLLPAERVDVPVMSLTDGFHITYPEFRDVRVH